jgi:hypothetical protein
VVEGVEGRRLLFVVLFAAAAVLEKLHSGRTAGG